MLGGQSHGKTAGWRPGPRALLGNNRSPSRSQLSGGRPHSVVNALPIIVVGAGGHAKVVFDALLLQGRHVLGFVTQNPMQWGKTFEGLPILGGDERVFQRETGDCELVNAVGSTGSPAARIAVYEKFAARGYNFASVIHPKAFVAHTAEIAPGTQIMACAVLQASVRTGVNCIINTSASVDHDCAIGDHAHVAPGAVLCGGVIVGARAHVGAGATVLQNIRLGPNCCVGA
ncbi:MAG: acetyltransferase, partial [Alphaproteobacteria bacterium]|nr:acetyltransferase [Alphaproteobacteria bacterium]